MAEEQKTETPIIPESKGNEEPMVTLSQDKLNALINEKFKSGATKANSKILEEIGVDSIDDLKSLVAKNKELEDAAKTELEKAQEAIEATKSVNNDLISKYEKLEEKNKVNTLALKHGIKDAEYLAFKYAKAKVSEDFNEDTFIKDFVEHNPSVPPKTDASNNNNNPSGGKDLRKMSINELKAYQATL